MQRRGLLGTLLQGMCGVNFIWRQLTDTIDLPTFCTCGGKKHYHSATNTTRCFKISYSSSRCCLLIRNRFACAVQNKAKLII